MRDRDYTVCDLALDVEEMEGLIHRCVKTAKVLEPKTKAKFMLAVVAALHELDERVHVEVGE